MLARQARAEAERLRAELFRLQQEAEAAAASHAQFDSELSRVGSNLSCIRRVSNLFNGNLQLRHENSSLQVLVSRLQADLELKVSTPLLPPLDIAACICAVRVRR